CSSHPRTNTVLTKGNDSACAPVTCITGMISLKGSSAPPASAESNISRKPDSCNCCQNDCSAVSKLCASVVFNNGSHCSCKSRVKASTTSLTISLPCSCACDMFNSC